MSDFVSGLVVGIGIMIASGLLWFVLWTREVILRGKDDA
jgi:hypothetical protein